MTTDTTTTTMTWDAINTTEGELDAGGTLTIEYRWWEAEVLSARDAQGRDLWPILTAPARAEVQAALDDALHDTGEGEATGDWDFTGDW